MTLSSEQFTALIEHYLTSCQEALDEFSSKVRSDTDFLSLDVAIEDNIGTQLGEEICRCVEELQTLNATVKIS